MFCRTCYTFTTWTFTDYDFAYLRCDTCGCLMRAPGSGVPWRRTDGEYMTVLLPETR